MTYLKVGLKRKNRDLVKMVVKKYPTKHHHKLQESEDVLAPGYEELSSDVKNIVKHLGEDYHRRKLENIYIRIIILN